MLLYLDTQSNRKEHPNENFARELFELFTLGEGHYTEQDIKEAARAFTGWHLDCHTGAFRVDLRHHDDGRKVVFGKSGPFEGDDILSLTLEQPQVARYIVGKLWREFISDRPDSLEVDRLAARLGVDMPITAAVAAVLQGRVAVRDVVEQLLARDPRDESC